MSGTPKQKVTHTHIPPYFVDNNEFMINQWMVFNVHWYSILNVIGLSLDKSTLSAHLHPTTMIEQKAEYKMCKYCIAISIAIWSVSLRSMFDFYVLIVQQMCVFICVILFIQNCHSYSWIMHHPQWFTFPLFTLLLCTLFTLIRLCQQSRFTFFFVRLCAPHIIRAHFETICYIRRLCRFPTEWPMQQQQQY